MLIDKEKNLISIAEMIYTYSPDVRHVLVILDRSELSSRFFIYRNSLLERLNFDDDEDETIDRGFVMYYDDNKHLIRTEYWHYIGNSRRVEYEQYIYDEKGRMLQFMSEQFTHDYIYDRLGRLISERVTAPQLSELTTYYYYPSCPRDLNSIRDPSENDGIFRRWTIENFSAVCPGAEAHVFDSATRVLRGRIPSLPQSGDLSAGRTFDATQPLGAWRCLVPSSSGSPWALPGIDGSWWSWR